MIKKLSYIIVAVLFFLVINTSEAMNRPVNGNAVMKAMLSHGRPRIFLLSYPRSGNTWMRYCIEVLTQRPTAGFTKNPELKALPMGYLCGHQIDLSKQPIWKIHALWEANFAGYRYNIQDDTLIFIIRNPKEAIIRQLGKTELKDLLSGGGLKNFQIYFNDLAAFDSWNPLKKIIIYYEDLLNDPEKVMASLINFLGDSSESFSDFFEQYEKHKAIALKFYEVSQTQGNDLLAHSRKISPKDRLELDLWMESTYPNLWKKYLKDRFSEEILIEQEEYNKRPKHYRGPNHS